MGLVNSLERLVIEHDRIGSPLRAELRPGASRSKVQDAVRGLGLEPHPDLLEFFAWHDLKAWDDGRPRVDWFWPTGAWRLEEALDEYRRCVEIGGVTAAEIGDTLPPDANLATTTFTGFWRTDWFPIFGVEAYAIECPDSGGSTPGAIWRVSWHPDSQFQTARVALSLTAFIDRAVELFRAGGYRWDPQFQAVVTVDKVFEQRGLGDQYRPHTAWLP